MSVPEDFESKLELNRFVITHNTIGEESPGDVQPEKVESFVKAGNKFCGTLINETLYIEDKLEKYLARDLANKIFGQKVGLFRKTAAANDKGLLGELEYLKELRNLLAHGKLVYEHQKNQLVI